MYENWAEALTVIWDFTLCPMFFMANLILIFIIMKYTPESTKTYASIILAITISECVCSIGQTMSSPRILPRGTQMFFIFRGVCVKFFKNDLEKRSQVCLYFYATLIQCYILNHIILIFSYIFRMLIITHPFRDFDRRNVVRAILICYSTAHFCYFSWVCYAAFQPMDVINSEISKFEPDIVGSNATYSGIIDLYAPSQIIFSVLSMTLSFFVIIVTGFCRWKISRFTRNYEYSESVKKMQKGLEMVFSAQAIGPLLTCVTTVLRIILPVNGEYHSTIVVLENLFGRPLVLMFIVNPIVTITFITPYKMAVLGWFNYVPQKILRRAATSAISTSRQRTAMQ